MEKLLKRSEVPVELTWRVEDIYATEAEYEAALEELKEKVENFLKNYRGQLNTVEKIVASVRDNEELTRILYRVSTFADLQAATDMTDRKNVERAGKKNMLFAELNGKVSFYETELVRAEEEILRKAKDECIAPVFLEDVLRRKPHMLSEEMEKMLSLLAPVTNAFYDSYEQIKQSDMDFGSIEVEGKTYPMSYVKYENDYCYSGNTELRRKAFERFSEVLRKYQTAVAIDYKGTTEYEKIMSDMRGYKDVFESLLFSQKVERDLYDRQIDVIMNELAPHMRKYAKFIQQQYGLDKMTFADLKLPLESSLPRVSVEEAKKMVAESLEVMGEEYAALVRKGLEERWVDFAENIGKSTGGFCAGIPGVHPYILLSWTGLLSEVFTLTHEMGHAVQDILTNENCHVLESGISTYIVEAPSTFHELLLGQYLMKKSSDPKFKRQVLSSIVENTYYHNFVTHLLEAHYQRKVYQLLEEGEVLDAETLNRLKRDTLEEFWGDAVEINEGAELTWMRQPHYYMGLYSYTYSAGLTVSTVGAQRVANEGAPAVKDWIEFLKLGGKLAPKDMAKVAGVDISTEDALRKTIAYIGGMIDEIIALTDEIR